MAKGYPYEKTAEGILIKGVRCVRPLAKDARPELKKSGVTVDRAFLAECVSNFSKKSASGKLYPQTLNHRGKRTGRVLGQSIVEHNGVPTVAVDLLLTEPETQARWLRGELPEISADIDLAEKEIFAVSLLETGEGHFGHNDIGQVYPADLAVSLSGEGHKLENVICLNYQEGPIMDEKKLLELLEANNKKLMADIDAKLELSKKADDPLIEEADKRDAEEGKLTIELAKRDAEGERQRDISELVTECTVAGTGLKPAIVRQRLEKLAPAFTDPAAKRCALLLRRQYADNLMLRFKRTNEVHPAIVDPDADSPDAEIIELKAEYAEHKDRYLSEWGMDEAKFIDSRLRAKRSVITV